MKKVFALLFILTLPTTLLAAGINTALNKSDINKQLEENLSRIENGPTVDQDSKSIKTDNKKEENQKVEVDKIESEIKKQTKETIEKIKEYCKKNKNKDVCTKQKETINAINKAQKNALKKLKDIK